MMDEEAMMIPDTDMFAQSVPITTNRKSTKQFLIKSREREKVIERIARGIRERERGEINCREGN